MSTDGAINLAASCGPMPHGGELASGAYRGNLILSVEGILSWTGPMRWGIRVQKPTVTKSGRAGKPEKLFLLVANDGESVPDLLRSLATMWEVGPMEPGVSYPAALAPSSAASTRTPTP